MRESYPLLTFCGKRSQSSVGEVRQELIHYLQNVVPTGYRPSRRELQCKFNLSFSGLFKSITDLYKEAGFEYVPVNNQWVKTVKAEILTNIVLSVLPAMGLKLIQRRSVNQRGVDIIAINNARETVGIEIKAYHKREMVKERNICQIKKFIEQETLDKCLLVTTTDKIARGMKLPINLQLILYADLKRFCGNNQRKRLAYIRNLSIHEETAHKKRMRARIIKHAKSLSDRGIEVTHKQINKGLHVELFTYFDSLIELYKMTGIAIPLRLMPGRRARSCDKQLYEDEIKRFLAYLKEEIKKGRYPTGAEIGNRFGISHIWNFVKVSNLYARVGVADYHHRSLR